MRLAGPDTAAQAPGLQPVRQLGPAPEQADWLAGGRPADLTVSPAQGDGWLIEAPTSSLARAGAYDMNGPTGLYWVEGERALFRWRQGESFAVALFEPGTGLSSYLDQYADIAGVSPDGRYALLKRSNGATAVIDTRTNRELWRLTASYGEQLQWFGPRFFQEPTSSFAVAEAESGKVWQLPEYVFATVGLQNELCYLQRAANAYRYSVICFSPARGEGRLLLESGEKPEPLLAADPAGRRLAVAYTSGGGAVSGASSWFGTGVAEATKPLPPMYLADALLLYDSETGSLRRFSLPYSGYVQRLQWSPDGAHIGVELHPQQRSAWTALAEGELWVLDLATGEMDRLLRFDAKKPAYLLATLDGGALLAGRPWPETPDWLVLGEEPKAWQPGKRLPLTPPGPPWWHGNPPPWEAYAGQDQVRVFHIPTGITVPWPWAPTMPEAHVAPSLSFRWLAVQKTNQGSKSGQLYFLQRQ